MNIAIVRAFILLRKIIVEQTNFLEKFEQMKQRLDVHDIQLSEIYDAIENLLDKKMEEENWQNRNRIGFK